MSLSAIRPSSGSEWAFIFRIALLRWTFTVASAILGNRGRDGDRRRQVGGRHGVDRAWPRAGIVAAVKEGRTTFQRILSYTLNSTV